MRLHRTTIAAVLVRFSVIHFSTTAAATKKPFSKILWKHRPKAIQESQKALTEYLHATRAVPFLYADNIARNSPQSLWSIVSKIPFSPSNFSCSLQRFLRYHPINELDFFLESIGLNCHDHESTRSVSLPNTFFLSDYKYFDVVCALAGMGFPWKKLGLLCVDGFSALESDPLELKRTIGDIKNIYGFNTVTVISICLAFPQVLQCYENMNGLLSDLKVLFLDYDLWSCVEGGDVDAVFAICEKIKSFYDLGCPMGRMGEIMGKNKNAFIEHSRVTMISKIEYFHKLDVPKDEIAIFILSRPEIFSFDLDTRVVFVSGFLKELGLNKNERECLRHKYTHVFGRHRLANLPNAMRSMNLGKWFFQQLKNGHHHFLLANSCYSSIQCTEDVDSQYDENLRKILVKRTHSHVMKKLKFLQSIGFGENQHTIKALVSLNSGCDQLQSRFDCLLNCGVKYSKVCAMLRSTPKVLNQREECLEKKIDYLCNEMGLSLESLDVFPGYLCFDLEKRIKPRHRFHKWLREQDLCRKNYSLATLIASSEKAYVSSLARMGVDVVRIWEEGRGDRAAG